MQQITGNIYVETKWREANTAFVVTADEVQSYSTTLCVTLSATYTTSYIESICMNEINIEGGIIYRGRSAVIRGQKSVNENAHVGVKRISSPQKFR